ncbi:nuclease-related domain-containing protein [Lacicoccus qingdaonensis]|uniref:Nuclease-related domain-containing protein n=1 Tax=Lacicoccus qingdaonensis TaxID=576118 RepID=A0A1G9HM42_9BACL|nr:nuclease-related domain-containing protein [Salinicoccus qingdaonensis]SDL14041.1 Nuclease-related domain-containing protein [Salinicoccus qingdaonensis]
MRNKTLEYQWLHILCARGSGDDKDVQNLKRLAAGYAGDCEFDDWLSSYGRPHWRIFKDIWIDAGGTTQIDTLLVTGEGVYVFDVKNYSGALEYVDGKWFSGGKRLNKDIFIQLKRSMEKVNLMHYRMGRPGGLHSSIVFINEHNDVKIVDEVDVEVMMRNDIKRKIHKIADEENWNGSLDIEQVARGVETFIIPCPYKPRELEDAEFERLRSGICCAECSGFDVAVNRYHVRCGCGHVESKEKAVLRTICEYGVLRHDRELKINEIEKFLGKVVSRRRLTEILRKNFKLVAGGKYARYENPRAEYRQVFKTKKFRYEEKIS